MIMRKISGLHCPDDDDAAEAYYRALKTAMLLSDWTDELSDAKICERYSVGPGDVYGMVESVNWLLHASAELARMFASGFLSERAGIRDLHEKRDTSRTSPTYTVERNREGSGKEIIQQRADNS